MAAKTQRKSGSKLGATIRTDTGIEFRVSAGPELQEFAVRWSYLIRNRSHWTETKRVEVQEQLRTDILKRGFNEKALASLGSAGIIELEIPYSKEEVNWESRVLPWEFVLTHVVPRVNRRSPIVVRYLKISGRSRKAPVARDGNFVFLESSPGVIGTQFDFQQEREFVFSNLRATDFRLTPHRISDPSLTELARDLKSLKPTVIHVAGVDTHQGAISVGSASQRIDDGVVLKNRTKASLLEFVSAKDFGRVVGRHCPDLVGLNIYQSASRIAPLVVAHGARCAIGFQDVVDDSLAELFYAEFYRLWIVNKGNTFAAFETALRNIMSGSAPLSGTGIALWSDRSVIHRKVPKTAKRRGAKETSATPHPTPSARIFKESDLKPGESIMDLVHVVAEPVDGINYSLLHNGDSVFRRLYIHNRSEFQINDLDVRLSLGFGDRDLELRNTISLTGVGADLKEQMRISLISSDLRRFNETVKTTLKLTVSWKGHSVFDRNMQVSILPMNEWQDSDEYRQLLPSFVQPNDPAIVTIKEKGVVWLRRFSREYDAGYDGYQQVDSSDEPNYEAVDYQVQAIWNALSYSFDLVYTNPPSSYTPNSQRIRTPSKVVLSKSGTCLDLAVLLASCLEEIDIFPVMFLLSGHAFPGFWRSSEFHEKFWADLKNIQQNVVKEDASRLSRGRLDELDRVNHWVLQKTGYDRMLRAIRRGELVPLESVLLTAGSSFAEAMEQGADNLRNRSEFECLLDVRRARQCSVLPLPETY